ncbi:MAG: hypothetical protein HPY90_13555 [Syntrophothermus sp.]|uniref:hypothetical protein n=1 Tax=Syntrophothermus sp. TaxID=2736299 RepID=UPI00257E6397|nr:hypothetical protein [Syntrophothermus sp.]NSW84271.1 hypothetical protein [Syntrophothermus sp.]
MLLCYHCIILQHKEGWAIYIVWTPIKKKYQPYLRKGWRENGKLRQESYYLGPTVEAAEAVLRRLKLPEEEKQRLIAELHRKQPKEPPTAQVERKAVRQLKRIAGWYPGSEKVQKAVSAALEILEGGKENG